MSGSTLDCRSQPKPGHSVVTPERLEQLKEIRKRVWQLQDRSFQIDQLEKKTRAFSEENYARQPEALQKLRKWMDYIFADKDPIGRSISIPRHISELLAPTPCLFTMYPGIGTHQSLSQYDIVLVDRYTTVESRSQVSLHTQITPSHRSAISGPYMVSNMRAVIGEELAAEMIDQGLIPVFHRFKRPLDSKNVDTVTPTVQSQQEADDEKIRWAKRFGEKAYFSCGTSWGSINLTKRLIQEGIGGVCIDVAIGNSSMAAATVLELREFIRKGGYSTQIVAGNVDTAEGYFLLGIAGADCVKVGIGPGSPCTTRVVTRAGAGQGSALIDVSRAQFVMGPETPPSFVADGGIDGPGDVLAAVALQAGAVMSGKLAARTLESGGLKRDIEGKPHVWYYGEASKWARVYERGGVKEGMAVEGEANWIPCSGHFRSLIHHLNGGLYNALPYYNSRSIPELQRKFSIPQQLCDLILGGETGIHQTAPGSSVESGTRLRH